jgi:hypothetical protein
MKKIATIAALNVTTFRLIFSCVSSISVYSKYNKDQFAANAAGSGEGRALRTMVLCDTRTSVGVSAHRASALNFILGAVSAFSLWPFQKIAPNVA